ncbi:hypothetical protein [Collimonas arenae]|nr:hypothetical protein [Collimonas arenae]
MIAPLLPLARRLFPQFVTTSEQIGRAMIKLARDGGPQPVLESIGINAMSRVDVQIVPSGAPVKGAVAAPHPRFCA